MHQIRGIVINFEVVDLAFKFDAPKIMLSIWVIAFSEIIKRANQSEEFLLIIGGKSVGTWGRANPTKRIITLAEFIIELGNRGVFQQIYEIRTYRPQKLSSYTLQDQRSSF